ncbi:adenosine-specific kinase [Candidatus Omnitrophota bacterium]
MELNVVKIEKPEDVNIIIGQTHFIKTVDDLYEVLISASPGIQFGLSFCEASGACLVRSEGNDDELKKIAVDNALALGCGHSFIVVLRNAFPINVLNAIKNIQEVCSIYCATANPLEIVVAETEQGRGVTGVIDGSKPKGVEGQKDIQWRKDLLKKLRYKL